MNAPGNVVRHPISVHAPIGLLVGGWVGAVARIVRPSDRWHDVVTFAFAAGLTFALVAATTGFIEFARLGSDLTGTPADVLLLRHLTLVLTASAAFGAALWCHVAGLVGITAIVASLGMGLLGVGGHLGGTLVYRHGIGTSHEPHPPAPP